MTYDPLRPDREDPGYDLWLERQITEAMEAAEEAGAALSEARRRLSLALSEARETMSLQEIADVLGVSRQRIHQLTS